MYASATPQARYYGLNWQRSKLNNSFIHLAASGVQGGSIQPMIASMCQTELTKARTEALRRYLDCKEGDLSCPVPAQ